MQRIKNTLIQLIGLDKTHETIISKVLFADYVHAHLNLPK